MQEVSSGAEWCRQLQTSVVVDRARGRQRRAQVEYELVCHEPANSASIGTASAYRAFSSLLALASYWPCAKSISTDREKSTWISHHSLDCVRDRRCPLRECDWPEPDQNYTRRRRRTFDEDERAEVTIECYQHSIGANGFAQDLVV